MVYIVVRKYVFSAQWEAENPDSVFYFLHPAFSSPWNSSPDRSAIYQVLHFPPRAFWSVIFQVRQFYPLLLWSVRLHFTVLHLQRPHCHTGQTYDTPVFHSVAPKNFAVWLMSALLACGYIHDRVYQHCKHKRFRTFFLCVYLEMAEFLLSSIRLCSLYVNEFQRIWKDANFETQTKSIALHD